MIGHRERRQEELFVSGTLKGLIPKDHILRKVDRVLDLRWLNAEIKDCYNVRQGRPGLAPETALRLMLAGFLLGNQASPGLSFHKLDKARDKNFWSVRVSSDIRIIVHRTAGSLLLCYVDHHDKAYHWAERRKLEAHPKTGAAQFVEIRERVQEIVRPVYAPQEESQTYAGSGPLLFASLSDDTLLNYGVPVEWLDDVRNATEDTYLTLADHLPEEAAEALLELATGGKPRMGQPAIGVTNPFEHPDALRRFRVMNNVEELQRALEFPWEKWTVSRSDDVRHQGAGGSYGRHTPRPRFDCAAAHKRRRHQG